MLEKLLLVKVIKEDKISERGNRYTSISVKAKNSKEIEFWINGLFDKEIMQEWVSGMEFEVKYFTRTKKDGSIGYTFQNPITKADLELYIEYLLGLLKSKGVEYEYLDEYIEANKITPEKVETAVGTSESKREEKAPF